MSAPTRLGEVVGNERLLGLLRTGRTPPSTIFSGPDGVGKKTVALLLAAAANCRNPVDRDLCGRCPSCIKALSGNHPDIVLIQREKNTIEIGTIRKLNQEIQYRPFEGKTRYFIIDEADRMGPEAANAHLKTLEEPPDFCRIILVTAYPQLLLSTIRSRCQTFAFQPLSRQEIQSCLESDGSMDRAEIRSRFAQGSIGRAIALDLDQTLEERDLMLKILSGWFAHRRFQTVFEAAESNELRPKIKKRDETVRLLEQIQLICYDLYYLHVDTPDRVVNHDRIRELQKLTAVTSVESIRDFQKHVSRAKRDVERYVNPLMAFEALWLEDLQEEFS
ncbi:MAG: DNA polymerase III subunit delta' [Acidobacteriota bacterium]|nr:MAG: DNA polymerase III subunit delta' [Acidobacteriota bacterium]